MHTVYQFIITAALEYIILDIDCIEIAAKLYIMDLELTTEELEEIEAAIINRINHIRTVVKQYPKHWGNYHPTDNATLGQCMLLLVRVQKLRDM